MKKRILLCCQLCLILCGLFSCGKAQNKDSLYFEALKSLENKDVATAIRQLEKGASSSNQYFSSLCILKLADYYPNKKVLALAKKHKINKSSDLSILENLYKIYYEIGEFHTIIDETKNGLTNVFTSGTHDSQAGDLSSSFDNKFASNKIEKVRLLSMYKTGHPDLKKEEKEWLTSVPFSASHSEYLQERYEDAPDLYKARNYLFKQNYSKAFLTLQNATETLSEAEKIGYFTSLSEAIISDFGKVFLYSDADKDEYGKLFLDCANATSDDEMRYYFLFYSARIYERKGKENYYKARELYKSALNYAFTKKIKDNALWYYLRCENNISKTQSKAIFTQYASEWNDAYYFDDLLSICANDFLTEYKWQSFYDFFSSILDYLSAETKGKINYIFGRLVQNSLVKTNNLNAEYFFEEAFNNPKTDIYYKTLAAKQLKIDSSAIIEYSSEKKSTKKTNNYEKHLKFLVEYGFFNQVYDFYTNHSKDVSLEVVFDCAEILENAGEKYYSSALRMCSNAKSAKEEREAAVQKANYAKSEWAKIYPNFFEAEVNEIAKKYLLPEYVLYGLIRTESFFDAKVVSSAGAVGLCQLIPSTAGDVARKLKKSDYDLRDAATNIEFGAFYLQELIGRLDNNILFALCSYNAGINRVRNWAKAAPQNLPIDLFIETIPFEETREYGKKIVSASIFYGQLYYDLSPLEVIEKIFAW